MRPFPAEPMRAGSSFSGLFTRAEIGHMRDRGAIELL
jgi:hypothetical protein